MKKTGLFLLGLLLSIPAMAELPDLGDPTQRELTPYREQLMGRNFYRTLKANVPFIEDLEVNDYIRSLGLKLVSNSLSPQGHFRFFVIRIPSINAFAGPYGYIGFHSGLIIEADNESEFAGVMAHEISHVTQRHLARQMTENSAAPGAIFAAILTGILVASQNPEAGAALIYGSQAALIQSQINFTRANEHEADRIGIDVMRKSGINPSGMANFFNTLLEQSRTDNVLAQMEYLRTHPLNTTRIAEASNRLTAKDQSLPLDSLDFQLTRARVAVASASSAKQLIERIQNLPADEQNLLSRYTLAIAYIADYRPAAAIPILKDIITENPHPWFPLALSDAYLGNDQLQHALEVLENIENLYPGYLPGSIRYATALILNQKASEAVKLLNTLLRKSQLPVIYKTLARAYFANGQVSLAMEATSYEYELEGYLNLAIQQVNNALQQPELNKLTRQRLESRKQTLADQIKKEGKF